METSQLSWSLVLGILGILLGLVGLVIQFYETRRDVERRIDLLTNVVLKRKIELLKVIDKLNSDRSIVSSIQNSFNKASSVKSSDELRSILEDLTVAIGEMTQEMPLENANLVVDDLDRLIDETTRERPDPKWWRVSIDGIQKAAQNLGEVGEPGEELVARVADRLSTA